jgi:hypothetical protein
VRPRNRPSFFDQVCLVLPCVLDLNVAAGPPGPMGKLASSFNIHSQHNNCRDLAGLMLDDFDSNAWMSLALVCWR